MDNVQQAVLHQQRVEELCATTLRALSGDINLHFRGRRLYQGSKRLAVYAPHLQLDLDKDDFNSFRAMADGVALRLCYSDSQLHQSLCPENPIERLIFELLEQLRVETLVPDYMPGVKQNLRFRFEQWSQQFHHSGYTDSDVGLLIYTLAQICWARLTGLPVLEETEDLLEPTRGALGPVLGHDLAEIKRCRNDQKAFARHALGIAKIVAKSIGAKLEEEGQEIEDKNDRLVDFNLWIGFEDDVETGITQPVSGDSKTLDGLVGGYRVFARQYDQEIKVAHLVRKQQLISLRNQLDLRISRQGINVTRLSRLFKYLFAIPQRDGWSFGQEEGYIDGRRLSQLISAPSERRLFRLEHAKLHADCLVSVLIDCSGSMKQYMESIAMLVDVLVRALEQAEAMTEVIGFTTNAWSGGRANRDWVRAGRPDHPGRLNETCHMIYKSADISWRRARSGIAALLKTDLFREGVDGEAVEWACERMSRHETTRKILIVISDGSPMDTATHLANDKYYLDHHLRDVVRGIETNSNIEIYGLGVGLDLSPYYSRSLAIDISKSLDNEVFFKIIQMLKGRHRR